ncbi:uncharacterized protein LOC116296961 [Actinia tenebrosa]|uniref:Uncharacterized protein LOC116296961 n=1 Tax=Actinia tenebrosa TaxID=6105 RepID=A0A6P8I094_ACTTE|nr:uncharacterized protein LOC116296961 [Actinia tenebrosa]
MTTNPALAELESTADVGEAKRDLVLRFVRDQESLQTSQVELKLVDDDTIDLIDSAFTANEIALQKNNEQINTDVKNNEDLLRTGVSGLTLDDDGGEAKGLAISDMEQVPRPPSGRPQSRKAHRKRSSEFKEKRKISYSSRINDIERFSNNSPMSPFPVDAYGSLNQPHQHVVQPDFDSNSALNSSWPQQILSRKSSAGSSYRKHALHTPEKHLFFEGAENVYPHETRPTSSQNFQRLASGEALMAARVRKHSANERITCNINQMMDSPIHHSRSSSPTKSTRRLTSRGRTLINLGLEPVDPSEIPILRAASAGKAASLSGPYALVQLPPISRETPTAMPPFS